jgi:putative addiction module component (TIGR02574 family)
MKSKVMNTPFPELFALPIDERLRLVQELWDSIISSGEEIVLTDWQKQELDRRKASYEKNESTFSSWDEVRARIQGERG